MATKNDVAHSWAHQLKTKQTCSNFSFEGCLIYSYGTAIGEIITLKDGRKIYVLNTGRYSKSTSKHQGCAFGAIPNDAIKFSVSCDEFKYGWHGLTCYSGTLDDEHGKRTSKAFVQYHLQAVFEMLEEFATSKCLAIEENFSLKWFDEAKQFCDLTKTATIKQVLKEKSATMKKWWHIDNPAAFKKTMLAILAGERSLRALVDMANGDGTFQEYLDRTKGLRAAKKAREINAMLGFESASRWDVYYIPYHYNYDHGGKYTSTTFPTNETYISRQLRGCVKGGFKAAEIEKLRKSGELTATLLKTKKLNFQQNCEAHDKDLRFERQRRASNRLALHIGLTGYCAHWYHGLEENRQSFSYNGVTLQFHSWNSELPLSWNEYIGYTKMNIDEQKEFIHTKRMEMLAHLQQQNADHERSEREWDERRRLAREEQERMARLYEEKRAYIEELKATGDQGIRQLWREGLMNSSNFYEKPNSFFYGGNALLRVSLDGKQVESSKGIIVPIPECKRLWLIINRWHNEHKEFDINNYEMVHATTHDWGIRRYQNDIMIAGCHAIAYSEMAAVAKQLGFC